MKFGNLTDWQSDPQMELDGVPLDIGRGRAIHIRRAGGANRAFLVAYGALIAKLAGDRGDPEKVAMAQLNEGLPSLFAEHVVTGWSGIKDDAGEPIPYSAEAFLLLVKECPDLWMRIRAQADQRERFQRESIERDKTRLGKSWRGKRNGGASAHA
jgi:hypothetical protein